MDGQPFTYWRESEVSYLGHLNEYPDHWTQACDLDDLKAHLLDLYREFAPEDLPGIRRVALLSLARNALI